jgi:hypothetical protein
MVFRAPLWLYPGDSAWHFITLLVDLNPASPQRPPAVRRLAVRPLGCAGPPGLRCRRTPQRRTGSLRCRALRAEALPAVVGPCRQRRLFGCGYAGGGRLLHIAGCHLGCGRGEVRDEPRPCAFADDGDPGRSCALVLEGSGDGKHGSIGGLQPELQILRPWRSFRSGRLHAASSRPRPRTHRCVCPWVGC